MDCILFLGIFFGLIIFAFIKSVHSEMKDKSNPYTSELVAFSNNSKITGSFFLACGSIDQEEIYKYLRKTKNGAIIQRVVPIHNAYIYEIPENEKPYVNRYLKNGGRLIQADFYIPANSINRTYELDITKR